MEPLVRNQPDELASLVMENELLRYEVVHLRARLAAAEKARAKSAAGRENPDDSARADLVWLLERLDRSPAGSLLRARKGFRAIRDKYLGGPAGG
jgi:hypothetical protein